MCDANKFAKGIRGRNTQSMDDRKDQNAELGLSLSRTKARRTGERNVQGKFRPQWGGTLADAETGCGSKRSLQPALIPLTHIVLIFYIDTRRMQFSMARDLCVIFQKRSCDFPS